MKRFQHLTFANNFPGDDVRPFQQFQNAFDYDRWAAETILRPCTVRWTLETNDRVKWTSDKERNAWFDNLKGETYTLTSAMNRVVSGENVKLPIPWQALQFANYLEVQVPDEPGEGDPLDYSTPHVPRVYYFIADSRYIAPNVTECVLVRDNWTTYINAVNIPRIELERGHQAMTGAMPEQYLADPINNLSGLTETEPDAPDSPVKVTSNRFHPLGKGEMWLMIAVKCSFGNLANLVEVGAAATSTPAKYSDATQEWGQDYVVTDYAWGGVPQMNDITTPVNTLTAAGGTHPTGMATIALPGTDTQKLVNVFNTKLPQMWNLIAAAWVLPRDMFDVWDDAQKLGGVEVWHVRPAFEKSLSAINLKTSDFNYNAKYQNLTKLYTAPYAWLEITNGDTGETATIHIEDTTNRRDIAIRANLAYPYLKSQTFLNGVGGGESVSYEWRGFTGGTQTTTISASAWRELSTHEIPTFSLFVDSSKMWALDNYASTLQTARANAIRSYHAAERNTNVAQLNATDSANTGLTNTTASANTALGNATASADTGLANTTASADTGLANATASADTGLTNTNRNADTALDNATDSANTGLANATTSANTTLTNTQTTNTAVSNNARAWRDNQFHNNIELNNEYTWHDLEQQLTLSTKIKDLNNTKISADEESDRDYMEESYKANADSMIASAIGTAVTAVGAVGVTIASGGTATPLLAAGFAGVSAANTGYNAATALSKNEGVKKAAQGNLEDKAGNARKINDDINTETASTFVVRQLLKTQYNTDLTNSINDLNETQTSNTVTASNTNASRTHDTTIATATASKNTTISTATATRDMTKTNARATRDVTVDNATATKDTTIANATATKNTAIANATATKDTTITTATATKNTSVNNTNRSRNASTFANQTALDIAQANWIAKLKDMQRSKASEITNATGDASPDMFGVRGIQVRVMTQNDDVTRRCGDDMLKHGYTWHANIENPSLNLMKNFTFWRGTAQLIPIHAPAQAVNDIAELFREGVTIWRSPDKIGSSIYENLEA